MSSNIGPSLRFIAGKDMPLGSWETRGGAGSHIRSGPIFSRHEQHAAGERLKRGRVEKERRAQYDPAKAIGMLYRQFGDIAR